MKNLIIAVLGILVVLFTIDNFGGVHIFPKKSCETEKCNSTKCKSGLLIATSDSRCKNGKLGGGYSIPTDSANAYIDSFKKGLKSMKLDSLNSGAYISKDAIDLLFENDTTATGLVMCFVKANAKTISLVITTDTTGKCGIRYKKGESSFICETFCPKICGCFEAPKKSNLFTILYQDMNFEQIKK